MTTVKDVFAGNEVIAVTGMSRRLPKAPNPYAFWQFFRSGGDAITKVPADREEAGQSRVSEAFPGTSYGGYLESVDRFDAEFFDISPREGCRDRSAAAAGPGAQLGSP
jgi:acyl transferase domain-containing protein